MVDNPNVAMQPAAQDVLANSFAAKCSTKGEVWRFLSTEAKIYLPPYTTVTIWHMKDLASGSKKVGLVFGDNIFKGYSH